MVAVATNLPVEYISAGDSYYYYSLYENLFEEGACYRNSFRLMPVLSARGIETRCVVGYILSGNKDKKVAIRHCWLKDKRFGSVIDVSVPASDFPVQNSVFLKYVPVAYFEREQLLGMVDVDGHIDLMDIEGEEDIVKALKAEGFDVRG